MTALVVTGSAIPASASDFLAYTCQSNSQLQNDIRNRLRWFDSI